MLIFENYIRDNKAEFLTKLKSISYKLGIDPNWLMAVMYLESKINQQAVNSSTRATGLIQFMPDTAKGLGTTVEHLKTLTNVQQLDYVEKYYRPYRQYLKNYPDLYLATFFPKALKYGDNYVLEHLPKQPAWLIAKSNPGVNLNKDNKITKAEFYEYCYKKLPQNAVEILKKKYENQ